MFKNILFASIIFSLVVLNSCKEKNDDPEPNEAPTGKIEVAQWLYSDLYVKVTYADSDGTVATVRLKVIKDGQLMTNSSLAVNISSGSITFANVINAGISGSYEIYAEITDNSGNVTKTNVLKENVL